MLTKSREQEIISLCQDLIRIKSYSGEEGQAAERLKTAFEQMGYDDFLIEPCGSVIGHIKGSRPGKKVLMDGHIDTVPVEDLSAWQHNPFSGEIDNGCIYGRGASDMKGAVTAMLCAGAYLAQDLNKDFAGDIYLAGAVHEECFEGVASRNISQLVKPDYVIIGEASALNLRRGQRGRAEIVVETFGKPAHSSNPGEGINAVYKAMQLIQKIQELGNSSHPVLGQGILELTDIKSAPYPGASVVPSHCRITYDRRLLVGETKESVLAPILQAIGELEREDPDFKAMASYAIGDEQCYTGEKISGSRFFPAWLLDDNDELLQKALIGLKKVGFTPEIGHWAFCTNGSHYAGEAGIKTIGFGPSYEYLAHTDDEYIEIKHLLQAVQGYYGILDEILK